MNTEQKIIDKGLDFCVYSERKLKPTRLLNCHKWKYLIKCNKESNQFKRNIVKSFYLIIQKLRILEKSSSIAKILGLITRRHAVVVGEEKFVMNKKHFLG